MLMSEEAVDLDLSGAAIGSYCTKLTKAMARYPRREFTFDGSDSEQSYMMCSSEEINEMSIGLGERNGAADCRSAKCRPFDGRRQSSALENWELRSRRRHTLALSTLGTLLEPTVSPDAETKFMRRQTIAEISSVADNLFRRSSTGNIEIQIGYEFNTSYV